MPADDNLRDLFNEVAPPPEPSSEQRERARAQLRDEFRSARRPRPQWRHRPATAVAAAATVAAVVVGVLVLPTSAPSVDANLANIARAARTVEPLELPDGAYIYSRTESLIINFEPPPFGAGVYYLLPETIDVWVQDNAELSRRTATTPRFFSEADEEAYYAAGQDVTDRIGETIPTTVTDIPNNLTLRGLSSDVNVLREQIFDELSEDPDWTSADEAAIVSHIADLLNPRFNAPPEIRAALIEVVGTLDITSTMTNLGRVTASLEYKTELGTEQLELEFDAAGYLAIYRLSLLEPATGSDHPSGLLTELSYSRPTVVATAGELPDS